MDSEERKSASGQWSDSMYGGSRYTPVEGVAFLPDDCAVVAHGQRTGSTVRILAIRQLKPEPAYDVDLEGERLLFRQSELESVVPKDIGSCLAWIQKWYAKQCDADWEHTLGFKIDTLDNPGWSVRVDLEGTELEDASFEKIDRLEPKRAWLLCRVREKRWEGFGGPHMLGEILMVFVRWAASFECAE